MSGGEGLSKKADESKTTAPPGMVAQASKSHDPAVSIPSVPLRATAPDPLAGLSQEQQYVAALTQRNRIRLALSGTYEDRQIGMVEWVDSSGNTVDQLTFDVIVALGYRTKVATDGIRLTAGNFAAVATPWPRERPRRDQDARLYRQMARRTAPAPVALRQAVPARWYVSVIGHLAHFPSPNKTDTGAAKHVFGQTHSLAKTVAETYSAPDKMARLSMFYFLNLQPHLLAAWEISKDFLASEAMIALLASFTGAYFAFRLERTQKRREDESKNLAAANRAMMTFIRMYSVLAQLQRQVIDPYRDNAAAFIAMPPHLPEKHDSECFDMSTLEFLSSPAEQQILLDLWIEERRFHQCVDVWSKRSHFHLEEVQIALDQAGKKAGDGLTLSDIEAAIGNRRLIQLRKLTHQLVDSVDLSIPSLRGAADRLRIAQQAHFPDRKILDFVEVGLKVKSAVKK